MPYLTQSRRHFDVCHTFEVIAAGDDLRERRSSEHIGLEFSFFPECRSPFTYMELRGKRWAITPKSGLIYNGNETHVESYSDSPEASRVDAIVFHPRFMNEALRAEDIRAEEIIFDSPLLQASPRLTALMKLLMRFRRTPEVSQIAYDCLGTEILAEALLTNPHSHSEVLRARLGSGHFPGAMQRAKRLMAERFRDPSLSLEQIAHGSGLSKFHFIREFRKQTGLSPKQYLNTVRVSVARSAIAAQGRDITGAAFDSGFASLSTFNKAHRRISREAPSALCGTQTNKPRGTQTNKPRGTQTNIPRGTQTNIPRGTQTNTPRGTQTNIPPHSNR